MEDTHIDYQTEFRDIECRKPECGYKGQPITNGKFNFQHGHGLYCPKCGLFYGWGGRKKKLHDDNGDRRISTQWTPKRLKINLCQMCLRTEDQLGDGEVFESHHVIAVKDGGDDKPENIWVVCTPCHKDIHHRRTYINRHLSKYYDAYRQMEALHEQS